jgi:RNA polymerase sigma-70 factor (ECF subfamily)
VHDSVVAEDIASDSLIYLWQTLKQKAVEYPHSYLLVILKNNALNYLKREGIHQNVVNVLSEREQHDLDYRIQSLEACNPEEIFSTEINEILKKTLDALPEQTRRVFEMSRFDLLSVKEIAMELEVTPKAVEYHITKSLKALRVTLKDYLPVLYLMCLYEPSHSFLCN